MVGCSVILNNVIDQIGTQLDTIAGLRVYDYPADRIVPPAVIVAYPESITFDETYGRGMDRLTLPILLMVGKVSDRASRDALSVYVDGAGAKSVKAVVESGVYTAFHTVRVMNAEFDIVTVAGVDYAAALFDLDIVGSGA